MRPNQYTCRPSDQHLVPTWSTDDEINRIFTTPYAELGGRTIEEALKEQSHAVYFGVTKLGMKYS